MLRSLDCLSAFGTPAPFACSSSLPEFDPGFLAQKLAYMQTGGRPFVCGARETSPVKSVSRGNQDQLGSHSRWTQATATNSAFSPNGHISDCLDIYQAQILQPRVIHAVSLERESSGNETDCLLLLQGGQEFDAVGKKPGFSVSQETLDLNMIECESPRNHVDPAAAQMRAMPTSCEDPSSGSACSSGALSPTLASLHEEGDRWQCKASFLLEPSAESWNEEGTLQRALICTSPMDIAEEDRGMNPSQFYQASGRAHGTEDVFDINYFHTLPIPVLDPSEASTDACSDHIDMQLDENMARAYLEVFQRLAYHNSRPDRQHVPKLTDHQHSLSNARSVPPLHSAPQSAHSNATPVLADSHLPASHAPRITNSSDAHGVHTTAISAVPKSNPHHTPTTARHSIAGSAHKQPLINKLNIDDFIRSVLADKLDHHMSAKSPKSTSAKGASNHNTKKPQKDSPEANNTVQSPHPCAGTPIQQASYTATPADSAECSTPQRDAFSPSGASTPVASGSAHMEKVLLSRKQEAAQRARDSKEKYHESVTKIMRCVCVCALRFSMRV